jgi:hypothetical protein
MPMDAVVVCVFGGGVCVWGTRRYLWLTMCVCVGVGAGMGGWGGGGGTNHWFKGML